ncbi:PREDICTED: regucalcin-like isoform X2 [Vollenhovia emeryi]|uniref:regucalcin-like isoform X2 n=1 Tax=Vollenhovia emeryi TaxID=411798 RepID=UPI0005F439E6|nr:PREDICTED: regucalcin-like isoform X2 [Vollenhovia emeryi]
MRRTIGKYVFPVCVLVAFVSGQVTVDKVTAAYGLSEGPHWDHRTQKLFFVDIQNQYIRRLDIATGVVTSAYIANGTVGVVIPVDDSNDELVAGVGKDLVLVKWNGDEDDSEPKVKMLCSLEPPQAETRINDGKVDSTGRFWLGTMGIEVNGVAPPDLGSLYRVDDNLKPEKEISPVTISNGLAWNSKDDTFYYIDSPTRQVAAYDYDPNLGKISNRRIVFDLNNTDLKGVPDGMTIDTDGNLWIALFGGSHVIQVDPKTGAVMRKVKIPADNVTSVTFGGPLLDTLYVTTSGYNLTAEQRELTPDAGAVFAVKGLKTRGTLANSFVKMD